MTLSLISLSFEFFPPTTPQSTDLLWQHIQRLAPLAPEFISVTYGAGGTTRERTHDLVVDVLKNTSLRPAAHLTCVGSSRDEIAAIAKTYWDEGIRHLVALRGDKPKDQAHYVPHSQGYGYADELVGGLKEIADFEISVAAYPETHPEARSQQDDIDHLKRKLDAGATRAITQYFFDNDTYFRFMEKLQSAGIHAPVIPGILPIANIAQTMRFSAMCGATVPHWLQQRFEGIDDAEAQRRIGTEIATTQCEGLMNAGVTHLHFYTLNRSEMVHGICRNLGISASG